MSSLHGLLARLAVSFPASHPLVLKPSADAFAPHAARFSGGHAARWYAALDGQEGDEPFANAHVLCSLEDALAVVRIADDLRSEPDGSWIQPHWLAISTDLGGQHWMIDDHDGRVLAVAHDDDHVTVLAPSVEAWLESWSERLDNGTVVWDEVLGLMTVADRERRDAERAPPVTSLTSRQKLGLALSLGGVLLLVGAWIGFLESRR